MVLDGFFSYFTMYLLAAVLQKRQEVIIINSREMTQLSCSGKQLKKEWNI